MQAVPVPPVGPRPAGSSQRPQSNGRIPRHISASRSTDPGRSDFLVAEGHEADAYLDDDPSLADHVLEEEAHEEELHARSTDIQNRLTGRLMEERPSSFRRAARGDFQSQGSSACDWRLPTFTEALAEAAVSGEADFRLELDAVPWNAPRPLQAPAATYTFIDPCDADECQASMHSLLHSLEAPTAAPPALGEDVLGALPYTTTPRKASKEDHGATDRRSNLADRSSNGRASDDTFGILWGTERTDRGGTLDSFGGGQYNAYDSLPNTFGQNYSALEEPMEDDRLLHSGHAVLGEATGEAQKKLTMPKTMKGLDMRCKAPELVVGTKSYTWSNEEMGHEIEALLNELQAEKEGGVAEALAPVGLAMPKLRLGPACAGGSSSSWQAPASSARSRSEAMPIAAPTGFGGFLGDGSSQGPRAIRHPDEDPVLNAATTSPERTVVANVSSLLRANREGQGLPGLPDSSQEPDERATASKMMGRERFRSIRKPRRISEESKRRVRSWDGSPLASAASEALSPRRHQVAPRTTTDCGEAAPSAAPGGPCPIAAPSQV